MRIMKHIISLVFVKQKRCSAAIRRILCHKGTWFETQAVVHNSGLCFCGMLVFIQANAVQSHVIIKLTCRPTLDIVHHFALLIATRFGVQSSFCHEVKTCNYFRLSDGDKVYFSWTIRWSRFVSLEPGYIYIHSQRSKFYIFKQRRRQNESPNVM